MSQPVLHPEKQSAASGDTSVEPVPWQNAARSAAFGRWLSTLQAAYGLRPASLRLASADASFRRYLRIDSVCGSRVIMDAPPDKEDCRAFERVARLLHEAGLNVPRVLAWDQAQGFMLLSDLGEQSLMDAIQPRQPQANLGLYLQAVEALLALQLASRPDVLPPCGEALLLSEMELFVQWYLVGHRGIEIDLPMRRTLDQSFLAIARENLAWPSVYVHCDFMPRNLMLPVAASRPGGETRLGVLDFQDAVYGPITYDIASLMRDAFLSWEEDFVLDVTIRYWEKARHAGLPVGRDFGAFYRAVEWMGLQRHLRVAGIFARLTLRDGKPRYLADTPRFIGYIRSTAARYRELKPLLRLLEQVEGVPDASTFVFGRP